jgi:hypothetical protein
LVNSIFVLSNAPRAFVVLLAAAIALDLGVLHVVAGPGISLKLGFFHLRIHDSRTPIAVAAALIGVIVGIGWRDDRRRALTMISVIAVGATAAIILARRAQPAFPLADIAVLEIYTREALTGRLLVGPYSRMGWHHPGPLYFYLAAPIYALGAAKTAALSAAAFVLSLTSWRSSPGRQHGLQERPSQRRCWVRQRCCSCASPSSSTACGIRTSSSSRR